MKTNDLKHSIFNIRRKIQLLSFLFSLFSFLSFGQVTSSIDSTQIKIGEEIQYTIQVKADTTDVVIFPEGQTFSPLEMIDSYKIDTTFEQAKYRLVKKYGLTQFDSGKYTIPQQSILINNKPFLTDSVHVEVRDVAIDTIKQKMFDIKPAVEVDRPSFNFKKLALWLLPLVLLLAVLGYVLFRRKKRKEAKEQILPPYEEAIVALKKLDESNLLRDQKSKEYYSYLTEIVKRYLDREVDDSALESTSDELIERLILHKDAGHFDFDRETIRHLDQILKRADLVKFAKMQQETGQAESDRRTIEEIINETHEAVPEPTEEELLANELYAEEQRKKRRRKRIIIGVVTGILVLMITSGVLIATYGYSFLKDNIIGHPIKELAEGRWIKSEYGNPAVIIETPKVLLRVDSQLPEEVKNRIKSNSTFAYGSLLSNFYVLVSTTEFAQDTQVDLSQVLESILSDMENRGATNFVVKQEEFETEKGIKGLKGYGTFTAELVKGRGKTEQEYQILVFGQASGLQQIIIAYPSEDLYAENVVDRMVNSVELEINEESKQNPQQ